MLILKHPKYNARYVMKIVLKHLDVLYIDKEVRRVFTLKPMILFHNARKLSICLVTAELYSTLGYNKCDRKHWDICMNINETSIFTSFVKIETYMINYRFDCNERCLVYILTCNKSKMQYVKQKINESCGIQNDYKNDSRKHGQGLKAGAN